MDGSSEHVTMCISRDGQQIGDWTELEVRALYKEGKLLPTDLYWRKGTNEWAVLDTLLFVNEVLPEGLRPVNKRRHVTASQIFPRIEVSPSDVAPARTTVALEEPVKFASLKSINPSKPLSFDRPDEEIETPPKTGWIRLVRTLFLGKNNTAKHRKALDLYVMQLNLRGAILIDSHTRLEGLKLAADGTIFFRYTVFTPTKPSVEELTKKWTTTLSREYRTSARDKVLRDYEVTTRHEFMYKDKTPITGIIIRPEVAQTNI
jgi:hypothetical protein